MNYYWTRCPKCSCEVTIQYSAHPDRLVGSVRRWSTDRSVNDGRRLEILKTDLSADGSFVAQCVCGERLAVVASAVERAATETPLA